MKDYDILIKLQNTGDGACFLYLMYLCSINSKGPLNLENSSHREAVVKFVSEKIKEFSVDGEKSIEITTAQASTRVKLGVQNQNEERERILEYLTKVATYLNKSDTSKTFTELYGKEEWANVQFSKYFDSGAKTLFQMLNDEGEYDKVMYTCDKNAYQPFLRPLSIAEIRKVLQGSYLYRCAHEHFYPVTITEHDLDISLIHIKEKIHEYLEEDYEDYDSVVDADDTEKGNIFNLNAL